MSFMRVSMYFILNALFARSCFSYSPLGFDIHHRSSDIVRSIFSDNVFPLKESVHFYAVMAHRDHYIHERRLAKADYDYTKITFSNSNITYRSSALGYLYYANVTVGTPQVSFLVALDTGSDLFWLPCDCSSCLNNLEFSPDKHIELSIYSPRKSSSSKSILCGNAFCLNQDQCSSPENNCSYKVMYLSSNTASSGLLVEDKLHLTSSRSPLKTIAAKVIIGCGKNQTGSFLDGAAPNGLFGLGTADFSVPSTLARERYVPNSFSMCFGSHGIGRIDFGDTGSPDQAETSFNPSATYNISITKINVGGNATNVEIAAIFDSGTSFTYLAEPAYSLISQSFNRVIDEDNYSHDDIPFEYCYGTSLAEGDPKIPELKLVMKGGSSFTVTNPTVIVALGETAYAYCLGIIKSENVNIIGQNFMTGYRIVFNREKKSLGWKQSNCYDSESSNVMPINPTDSVSMPPQTVVPEDTSKKSNETSPSLAPQGNDAGSIFLPMRVTIFSFIILLSAQLM